MHACMYVYAYMLYQYIHLGIYIKANIHDYELDMYICACTYFIQVCIHICVCLHTSIHVYRQEWMAMYVCMYIHIYTYKTYLCMDISAYMYESMYFYIYACWQTCIYVMYIHTHMIYMHAYIYV